MSHRRKNMENEAKIDLKALMEREKRKKIIAGAIAGAIVVAAIAGILILRNPQHVEPQEKWMTFNNTTNPVAGIRTNYGTIYIELYPDIVPITANNFIDLVEGGDYNNTIFHRVIDGFMIQGGDFTNFDGTGGHAAKYHPGYGKPDDPATWKIPDEFNASLSNVRGTISMANAGPNTGGSQFFINQVDNTYLNGKHAVFGKVIYGMDVVDEIAKVPTGSNSRPINDVKIISAMMVQ